MARVDDLIKCMASQLRDGDVVYVGLSSIQALLAVMLARAWGRDVEFLNVAEIYNPEDVVITPSSGDPFTFKGGVGIVTSLDSFDLARRGLLDVMFFSAAQVDRRGNMNLSVIGPYEKPRVRLPGGAAAAYLYRRARRVIMWLMEHSRRNLVERVDFITAPGPTRNGPELVVCTPMALFRFDPEVNELVLEGVYEDLSLGDVIDNMGFKPRVREPLTRLRKATEEEINILNRWDPNGLRYGRRP
ncbi:CoA-transferase subunit beta [Vulcanisaeta thermophila]|uniref:CoA-transferase subunit beta n=1 Tax=Vulcanisaeta thermophila TaxID=867917 RepID=UPI000852C13B|nr:CoA-transferase [Vulcanisaeta thermophila]